MPRRNRQKLHKELRLRAEARQSARRDARIRATADRERTRAAVEQALRQTVARRARRSDLPDVLRSHRELLKLAGVAAKTSNRVVRLVRALHPESPSLTRPNQLPWLVLLARQPWVRKPEDWITAWADTRGRRRRFAAYLLEKFPVPRFLFQAFEIRPVQLARVPVEDEWAVKILAHVGRGRSLRSLVGTTALPTPLTRRMCHLFLCAKSELAPVVALRMAQVAAHGGPSELAVKLGQTRLGRLHAVDGVTGEPFWDDVISWLCRRRASWDLDDRRLDVLLAFAELRARENGGANILRGRTPSSVLDEMDRCALRELRRDGDAFPTSGLWGYDSGPWTIEEILTPGALHDEGDAMSNCVWTYKALVEDRKVSLWSLCFRGHRLATVEVALGSGRVVQARRKTNRSCSADELRVIGVWARSNGLEVDLEWSRR